MSLPDNRVKEALKYCKDRNCNGCPYNTYGINCYSIMASDLFNLLNRYESEKDDLFYKLAGVMHSVDKWLEGDELKQDEVNRSATMREKTLQIVEKLKSENTGLYKSINDMATNVAKINEALPKMRADVCNEFVKQLKEYFREKAIETFDDMSDSIEYLTIDIEQTEIDIDNLLKDFVSKAYDSTTDKYDLQQKE